MKKTLRGRMVKLFITDFLKNINFELPEEENLSIQLKDKLKETFAFKCELSRFDRVDTVCISGQIDIEREDGNISIFNFDLVPSGGLSESISI